jgi:hypothetical protein
MVISTPTLPLSLGSPNRQPARAGVVKAREAQRSDRRRRPGLDHPEHAGKLVVFPSEPPLSLS